MATVRVRLVGRTLVSVLALGVACVTGADDSPTPPRYVGQVIHELPRTDEDVAEAHRACSDAGSPIHAGQPLETEWMSEEVVYRLAPRGSWVGGELVEHESCRNPIVSLGTRIADEDVSSLPFLTRRAIRDRVRDNYVCLEARVHRPRGEREAYLLDHLLAAVGRYGSGQSDSFARLTESAVREIKSLGLWMPSDAVVAPSQLRTLVSIYKTTLAVANGGAGKDVADAVTKPVALRTTHEMLFVRAREPRASGAADAETLSDGRLELHVFGTTGGRRRMHYLPPFTTPEKVDDCHVRSTVIFTDFALGQQVPTARASRHFELGGQRTLAVEDINAYLAAVGLRGDLYDQLTTALDAIIDGHIVDSLARP